MPEVVQGMALAGYPPGFKVVLLPFSSKGPVGTVEQLTRF